MAKLINNETKARLRQLLVGYLPAGKMWLAKNITTTNLYKLFNGIAVEYKRLKDTLYNVVNSRYVDETPDLMSEWEKDLNLPDDCIKIADNLTDRQKNVLLKYTAKGIQTSADFVSLAAGLGFAIEVKSLTEVAFPPYDVPFIPTTVATAKFTILVIFTDLAAPVSWPWTWPHSWVSDQTSLLRCVFGKVKPSNCNIVYTYGS